MKKTLTTQQRNCIEKRMRRLKLLKAKDGSKAGEGRQEGRRVISPNSPSKCREKAC